MWRSEWSALSRRISGFLEAAKFHRSCIGPGHQNDDDSVALEKLIPGTDAIRRELQTFRDRYASTLPPDAAAALIIFLKTSPSFVPSGPIDGNRALHIRLTALVALEAEISYCLTDFRARAKRLSERAFTHLQRSIVADPECAMRWRKAFEQSETACEKLGAAHLLWHGIWAFKVNTEGERTDLIMGDALHNRRDDIEEVAEALVLTEWKKVAKESELLKARNAAHKQAKLYAGSSLAGVELDAYRYLVLVTLRGLEMPPDIQEAGVLYRHINIAVAPPCSLTCSSPAIAADPNLFPPPEPQKRQPPVALLPVPGVRRLALRPRASRRPPLCRRPPSP
jgi:hypothetical protein